MRSPVRWAGSKKSLLPELIRRMPEFDGRYVEPFAGSACLYFALNGPRALLGDFNADLMAFYQVLRDHFDEFIEVFERYKSDEETYYELRRLNPGHLTEVGRAARFFYLNRYSFNGVYRTNKKGEFNVPRGNKVGSVPDEDELRRVSAALADAELSRADFRETLATVQSDDFVYIDPPYSNDNRRTHGEYGYGSFGGEKDLKDLDDLLLDLTDAGTRILLSVGTRDGLPSVSGESWTVATVHARRSVSSKLSSRTSTSEEVLAWNFQ